METSLIFCILIFEVSFLTVFAAPPVWLMETRLPAPGAPELPVPRPLRLPSLSELRERIAAARSRGSARSRLNSPTITDTPADVFQEKPNAILGQLGELQDDDKEQIDKSSVLVNWLCGVPRGKRLRLVSQTLLRRAAHSFFDNEEHSLAGISPTLDKAHKMLNTAGRILLPHPKLLTTVPPIGLFYRPKPVTQQG